MIRAPAAKSIPDLIAKMRGYVSEDMSPDDLTALELLEYLDITWCFAERWRIEQWDPEDDHGAQTPPRKNN